jgi:hypothetical protein
MTDDDFLAAFERCRLPREAWTHAAHVRMAWLYLRSDSLDRVVPAVRERIRRYNHSLGNTEGYHETITVAFLRLIDHRIALDWDVDSFAAFASRNADLLDSRLTALLVHYRRETLFGPEARVTFIEPDRSPLP